MAEREIEQVHLTGATNQIVLGGYRVDGGHRGSWCFISEGGHKTHIPPRFSPPKRPPACDNSGLARLLDLAPRLPSEDTMFRPILLAGALIASAAQAAHAAPPQTPDASTSDPMRDPIADARGGAVRSGAHPLVERLPPDTDFRTHDPDRLSRDHLRRRGQRLSNRSSTPESPKSQPRPIAGRGSRPSCPAWIGPRTATGSTGPFPLEPRRT